MQPDTRTPAAGHPSRAPCPSLPQPRCRIAPSRPRPRAPLRCTARAAPPHRSPHPRPGARGRRAPVRPRERGRWDSPSPASAPARVLLWAAQGWRSPSASPLLACCLHQQYFGPSRPGCVCASRRSILPPLGCGGAGWQRGHRPPPLLLPSPPRTRPRAAAGGSRAGDGAPAGSTPCHGAGLGGWGGPLARAARLRHPSVPSAPGHPLPRYCLTPAVASAPKIRCWGGGAGSVRVLAQHPASPSAPAPRGGNSHPFAHPLPGCPCHGQGALTCGAQVLSPMWGWVPASLAGYPRYTEPPPPPRISPGQGRVPVLSPGTTGPR